MRIVVFCVFCLVNYVLAQSSSQSHTLPGANFTCEELSSHIQTLKESTRTKKEKFSCILNLLKSALSDELDSQCQTDEENKGTNSYSNVLEEKIDSNNIITVDTAIENENGDNGAERVLYEKLVAKTSEAKTSKIRDSPNNTQNMDIPTMIPIFKPKPVIRNDFTDNFIPGRPAANPRHPSTAPQSVHANPNPVYNFPKFTIPCQRAADVLDMSNLALPREIPENQTKQNLNKVSTIPNDTAANEIPRLVSVHSVDSDETVALLFKPKAITLIQLYGNLLKKITITVLVPYHMSKVGQH